MDFVQDKFMHSTLQYLILKGDSRPGLNLMMFKFYLCIVHYKNK